MKKIRKIFSRFDDWLFERREKIHFANMVLIVILLAISMILKIIGV